MSPSMLWFVIGMLVLLAGGAGVLFLVFHMTEDHALPFEPDDESPVGSTPEHSSSPA